jgi:hypothetical protein
MKLKKLTWMVLMFLLMVIVVFSGCGGDGDDDSPTSPGNPLDVTGTWIIHPTGYSIIQVILTHTGTTITATELRTYYVAADGSTVYDDTAETFSGTTETPAGSTGSRRITLNVKFVGNIGSITMTGTVSEDNTSMNGDYVDAGGGFGTWTGTLQ